jgi:alpha-ketoglutarate-dependent taurine dioxygenase
MKVSKIPGLGSFGVYVDDIDMDHIDDEQWHELGKLFVKELVVICRDIKMTQTQYATWIPKWGPFKASFRAKFFHKYGNNLDATKPETWGVADEDDLRWLKSRRYQLEDIGDGKYLTRVYGRKSADGQPLGYFSHGEVYWHSNESSSLTFSPAVSLLGWDHMQGSSTGFVQTVDLYESLSSSLRSELDDMVLVHKFTPGRINDNELEDSELALHTRYAFCPEDGMETPLVCQAPNGRKGLRYTVNSKSHIKDLDPKKTQELFDYLDKLIFTESNIFDHFYPGHDQKDLLLFDNSVTLHRRLAGHPDRKAYRLQFDLSPLLDQAWTPWVHLPEYHAKYCHEISDLVHTVQGDLKARFKIPE